MGRRKPISSRNPGRTNLEWKKRLNSLNGVWEDKDGLVANILNGVLTFAFDEEVSLQISKSSEGNPTFEHLGLVWEGEIKSESHAFQLHWNTGDVWTLASSNSVNVTGELDDFTNEAGVGESGLTASNSWLRDDDNCISSASISQTCFNVGHVPYIEPSTGQTELLMLQAIEMREDCLTLNLASKGMTDRMLQSVLCPKLVLFLRARLDENYPNRQWHYVNVDLSNNLGPNVNRDLSSNLLGPSAAQSLADFFCGTRKDGGKPLHLCKLHLSNNQLGDQGAEHIARIVRTQSKPLHEIHLANNQITPHGASWLLLSFGEINKEQAYPWWQGYTTHYKGFVSCWCQLDGNLIYNSTQLLNCLRQTYELRIEDARQHQKFNSTRIDDVPHVVVTLPSDRACNQVRSLHTEPYSSIEVFLHTELQNIVNGALEQLFECASDEHREDSLNCAASPNPVNSEGQQGIPPVDPGTRLMELLSRPQKGELPLHTSNNQNTSLQTELHDVSNHANEQLFDDVRPRFSERAPSILAWEREAHLELRRKPAPTISPEAPTSAKHGKDSRWAASPNPVYSENKAFVPPEDPGKQLMELLSRPQTAGHELPLHEEHYKDSSIWGVSPNPVVSEDKERISRVPVPARGPMVVPPRFPQGTSSGKAPAQVQTSIPAPAPAQVAAPSELLSRPQKADQAHVVSEAEDQRYAPPDLERIVTTNQAMKLMAMKPGNEDQHATKQDRGLMDLLTMQQQELKTSPTEFRVKENFHEYYDKSVSVVTPEKHMVELLKEEAFRQIVSWREYVGPETFSRWTSHIDDADRPLCSATRITRMASRLSWAGYFQINPLNDAVGEATKHVTGGMSDVLDWVAPVGELNSAFKTVCIDVPMLAPGNTLGLMIDGGAVVGIDAPQAAEFGWQIGDRIISVNGTEAADHDAVLAGIAAGKQALINGTGPIHFRVARTTPNHHG